MGVSEASQVFFFFFKQFLGSDTKSISHKQPIGPISEPSSPAGQTNKDHPAKVELVAVTNKPVFKISTHTCESIGQVLKSEDMRRVFMSDMMKREMKKMDELYSLSSPSSQTPIHGFASAELPAVKGIGPVGLTLYGFRQESFMKKELSLGACHFVVPNDSRYVGSVRAFAALHASMLRRRVVAIVSMRLSAAGNGMRFAVLKAQEERFDEEDGEQTVPGGMHLFTLPYKDDLYTMWRHEMKPVNEDGFGNMQGNDADVC